MSADQAPATKADIARVEARLTEIDTKLASLTLILGTNATALLDDIKKMMNDLFAAQASATKAKKATSTEEKKGDAEEKFRPSHPDLSKLGDGAWKIKLKATEPHEKITPWIQGMYTHYPDKVRAAIGTEICDKVLEMDDTKKELAKKDKQTPTSIANIFTKQLWMYLKATNQLKDISEKLFAWYTAEDTVRNSQKINQATPEPTTSAEKTAASSIAQQATVIHTAATTETKTA
jgi:hypothetical protein